MNNLKINSQTDSNICKIKLNDSIKNGVSPHVGIL